MTYWCIISNCFALINSYSYYSVSFNTWTIKFAQSNMKGDVVDSSIEWIKGIKALKNFIEIPLGTTSFKVWGIIPFHDLFPENMKHEELMVLKNRVETHKNNFKHPFYYF
ncbi:hypothetical protein H8356DRAFT_1428474 [Neocallimastix lanati (nom. inval.)]|nr:hypothetical protein H8356DRAFT_1428474 [Neocallimastix sp. JGI-2020a]